VVLVTRRTSTRHSSKRRSSRRLRANSISRSYLKSYPKNKGFENADWKWAKTAFPLEKRRIVVTAFRVHSGVPRDSRLEQHFMGDAQGLKAAKAYASSLIAGKIAVATYVTGDIYLSGYYPKPWGGVWSHEWVSVEELANMDDGHG